jgi:hypothetical protein
LYYLYIKIHRLTGLRYLGQTKQDPYKYPGTGKDWELHLLKYGKEINTEILLETPSKDERNYWGRYYSRLWNVVGAMDDFGNKIWANMIPESGGGGVSGNEHYSKRPGFIAHNKDKPNMYQRSILSDGSHPFQREDHYDKVRESTSGSKNVNYNPTIFRWINLLTGERKQCTMYEMNKIYKLGNLDKVTQGKRKHSKNWSLEK